MIESFDDKLASIIGKPSSQRPFVCNGQPASCRVWVVGYNAATTGGDWWNYWAAETGFDYTAWRQSYDAERAARGKGPSATRLRIDRLAVAVPALLETNIYAEPSTNMANMPIATTKAFDLLISKFQPEIIVAHGVPAAKYLADWSQGLLITCRHLSRASYDSVDEVVERILSAPAVP